MLHRPPSRSPTRSVARSPARRLMATLLTVLVAAPVALPGDVDGQWAGGVGSLELEDHLWSFLTVDLETGAPDRRGRADVTGTLWFGESQTVTG